MFKFEIHSAWPWLRKHVPPGIVADPGIMAMQWVKMPDGRTGVLHHIKPDGTLAVRPIREDTFEYLPNTSSHWSMENRKRIPEEVVLKSDEVTYLKDK